MEGKYIYIFFYKYILNKIYRNIFSKMAKKCICRKYIYINIFLQIYFLAIFCIF